MRVGILPLGRPTFDVPFANEKLSGMLFRLEESGHEILGPRELLFDSAETRKAITELKSNTIDYLLLLQVTFTDASMTTEAARAFDIPMGIWAVPEPRLGGRLRLNAFCGLNLASHALGLIGRDFSWIYSDTDESAGLSLLQMFDGKRQAGRLAATEVTQSKSETGVAIAARIRNKKIARIGERPVGFDTCAYKAEAMQQLTGVEVNAIDLHSFFDTAREQDDEVTALKETTRELLGELDSVDQTELDRSLKLKLALDQIRQDGEYDAFAIRCWPETFTEYGGAVCGPASLLGENRVPCACEADVYGALTQLILQEVAEAPVFLADLVDMNTTDGTGVVWHCGQAPLSMCDENISANATIHTNRKMPLLFEFPLKPGRITLMRVSQAFGEHKMILSTGEVVKSPMTFTGTSGVVKFDRNCSDVLDDVMSSGLEHHMALAYGDHRDALISVAAALNLPVLEI